MRGGHAGKHKVPLGSARGRLSAALGMTDLMRVPKARSRALSEPLLTTIFPQPVKLCPSPKSLMRQLTA